MASKVGEAYRLDISKEYPVNYTFKIVIAHDSKSTYKSDNNKVLIAMTAKVHTKVIYEKIPISFFHHWVMQTHLILRCDLCCL